MSQPQMLCSVCGYLKAYCRCGTVCQPSLYEAVGKMIAAEYSVRWLYATEADPYGWAIITTAKSCPHRKGELCLCPPMKDDRTCAREGCPLLPENYKELFNG